MTPIPSFNQIYTNVLSELEAKFGVTLSTFGKVFLRAIAATWAGLMKLLYLNLGSVQKNIFVDSADPESQGGTLERFGRVKLGRGRFPAVAGQYSVEVTGTSGTTIPGQTVFKSDDNALSPGKLFVLDLSYTMTSSTDTITLRALDAGDVSALNVGDTLTLTAPISGIDNAAEVLSITVEPQEEETIEEYRAKAIAAYQLEPQGGAATDYRLWSADAQGVAQVYPYATSGQVCEIDLFVEATVTDSTDGKGTPSSAMLLAVEEVVNFDTDTTKPLNERGRRPLTVFEIHYYPINPLNVNINIAGSTGLTPEKEALLLDAITEKLSLIRPFVSAADILANKNDILSVNNIISWILEALPGSIFGTVTLNIDGIDYSTYTFEQGNIPYMNSLTFV